MSEDRLTSPSAAPPAAAGGAGPQFEGKVGAFYLLALLARGEPRGLPGAVTRSVAFQRRGSGYPLDDVIVRAFNADGSDAILEIQAKRSLTFTPSDTEFAGVVAAVWEAAQKPEFETSRYELAVAIARTTTRVEHACQETLHWARQLPDGAAFAAHIGRPKFASDAMRGFVATFRGHLADAAAPHDDEAVWRLLRRFQVLVFDFESPGSDYAHRARERARLVLVPDQANRAPALWPVLINHAGEAARAGGEWDYAKLVDALAVEHGFSFEVRTDLRTVQARLAEAAERALDDIKDQVGGVRLSRGHLVEGAQEVLESQRIVHIVGAGGVGKSWVMKDLARHLQPEGRIILLRNGRIIPGGWLPMAHAIGCGVSQDELFNELGCGGGATLFVDNIDQIADPGEWATVSDLLTGVARSPGWRAAVTGAIGNDEWKANLPAEVQAAGIGTLAVEPISDDETHVLSEGNHMLAAILDGSHPARSVARNLFYLSRMIELARGQDQAAARITTEMDLAQLWWRYGGGRTEDDGRFARLKVLRAMGAQVIADPSRVTFKTDDLVPSTVAELLRLDSMREDIKGATVSFRHDVLRDWVVGFMLHEDGAILLNLAMDRPLPPGLARGLEVAARLALETDSSGARWSALLAQVERAGAHGSWVRPVLLALPRSELALAHFVGLQPILFEDDGRRLSEIIRLMIAVESEPLSKLLARLQPSIVIPAGMSDLVIPRGAGWPWLVMWLVVNAKTLPTARIRDVAKVFQSWLISTQGQPHPVNTLVVGCLFDWLALIEEAMTPRMYRNIADAPPSLGLPHLREVRDEIRMTVFSFAHLHPTAADAYLSGLDPEAVRHSEMKMVLCGPSPLVRAAPAAMASFALATLIEREDPDDGYRSGRSRFGPFGVHDRLLAPASPGQGPFFELLEHASAEGLRLVRGLIEHATQWRREQYTSAGKEFPKIAIPFPAGTRCFEGDFFVYHWSRTAAPSVIAPSALMALEAWAHRQIEGGRPFGEVLDDVLGPDGSSVAFVLVAVDLALSHWRDARSIIWPLIATPQLLCWDDTRLTHDASGVDQLMSFEQESTAWRVKRADLDGRPSRRARLSNTIGNYVFHAAPEQLEALRAVLVRARDEIRQMPHDGEDPLHGLLATAERAVRMTHAEHWPEVRVTLEHGEVVEGRQFQPDPAEGQIINAQGAEVQARIQHQNLRIRIQQALLDRAKSTPAFVGEAVAWARAFSAGAAPQVADDDDRDAFDKKWDQRAAAMAAALSLRDYDGTDRDGVVAWALPVLESASATDDDDTRINDQIEYNLAAVAAYGFVSLYLQERNRGARDAILQLARYQQLAVIRAIGSQFPELGKIDAGLPRALIRIVMASAVHPRRRSYEGEDDADRGAYRERVGAAIAAERAWLDGSGNEPPWPELAPWLSRPRRGVRIDGWASLDEEAEPEIPDHVIDEHMLGALVGHLVRLTLGDVPAWLVELAALLMDWTFAANGPHGDKDRNRDHRPHTWNGQFFDFLGILCVALPQADVAARFVEPLTRFKDEAFYDGMAEFLRGFDRATRATDTKEPQDPAAIRQLLADRIRRGWNFKRIGGEKGFTSEWHAGDALCAMFFQPHGMMSHGRPSIPENWSGLDPVMPTLTGLVTGAPASGYLATLFLNLVEGTPRATLAPYVAKAAIAWSKAWGTDTHFWVEKDVGGRVCAWLERALAAETASAAPLAWIDDDLMRCLDTLVRSGVAQARDIEERVASLMQSRKSA